MTQLPRGSRPVVDFFKSLSKAEIAVAELIITGMSDQKIADGLFISYRTVGYHKTRIYKKMGVKSRAELIYKAHLNGYLVGSP